MFSAISLLVLACAITINAQGPLQCSEANIGNVPTSYGVTLPPAILEPSISEYIIEIPPVPQCGYNVSGVYALICDPGKPGDAPTGYFIKNNTLKVNRKKPDGYGSVTVTVYCIV